MVGRLAPPMSRCVSCAQEGVSVRPDRCYSVDTGACPPPTAHRHERGVRGDQRRGRGVGVGNGRFAGQPGSPLPPRTRLDGASLRPAGSDCACGAPMPPMRRTRVAEGERSANPTWKPPLLEASSPDRRSTGLVLATGVLFWATRVGPRSRHPLIGRCGHFARADWRR